MPTIDTTARSRLRYTNVAILLHWLIAAMIAYNLASGLLRPELPRGFFVFHISSGISILALSVIRVAWRLTHKPPPLLPMTPVQRGAAHTVHLLLYAAMLLLPFSGWALVSANPPAGSPGAAFAAANPPAANRPASATPAPAEPKAPATPPRPRGAIMIWGTFTLPLITPVNEIGRDPAGVPEQRELHKRIETFHLYGGWVMLLLLVLHVGGALKHQYIDRERELARMGIGNPDPVAAE